MNRILAIILSGLVVLTWELGAGVISSVMSSRAPETASVEPEVIKPSSPLPNVYEPRTPKKEAPEAKEELHPAQHRQTVEPGHTTAQRRAIEKNPVWPPLAKVYDNSIGDTYVLPDVEEYLEQIALEVTLLWDKNNILQKRTDRFVLREYIFPELHLALPGREWMPIQFPRNYHLKSRIQQQLTDTERIGAVTRKHEALDQQNIWSNPIIEMVDVPENVKAEQWYEYHIYDVVGLVGFNDDIKKIIDVREAQIGTVAPYDMRDGPTHGNGMTYWGIWEVDFNYMIALKKIEFNLRSYRLRLNNIQVYALKNPVDADGQYRTHVIVPDEFKTYLEAQIKTVEAQIRIVERLLAGS